MLLLWSFGGLHMNALLLDYIVSVLDRLEYQLEALFFLRCELPNSEQRKQKLSEYPQCLALVEDIEENWTLRNRFLNRQSDIANAALLWLENKKPANRQAYELWIGFLAL
jgi:hypothetical protein